MDKLQKNEILDIEISEIGFEGSGIGKIEGNLAIFVPYTVPGDRIEAQIIKHKKNLAEAKLIKIIKPSPERVEADCSYFGTCNGCKLQHISYSKQLEIKYNNVINSLARIGGFKDFIVQPVIKADDIYYYRNKLEFSFSSNRWLTADELNNETADKFFALGFHKPGFIDKVIDINKCLLQSDFSNYVLNTTREFFKSRNVSIYSTKTHTGFLRFLIIRRSGENKDVMVNLITSEENEKLVREYCNHLLDNIPEKICPDKNNITVIHSVSSKKAQAAQAEKYFIIHGKGYIEENLNGLKFKISPFSFFQTNTRQCKKLFETITETGSFSRDENVLDLYCGSGAISLYISGLVKSVHGIEQSGEAIDAANENSRINNINNCTFETGDVKDFLKILAGKDGDDNHKTNRLTVILDPPRSGIHPKSAEYLLQLEPKKILYVSCNPATQARDIKLLAEKYIISTVQPVDMFPHTTHIENVVRLDIKE